MNEEEKEAALLQISKMQEAAKDGLLYTLQTYVAQLQNQLDKLVRRESWGGGRKNGSYFNFPLRNFIIRRVSYAKEESSKFFLKTSKIHSVRRIKWKIIFITNRR